MRRSHPSDDKGRTRVKKPGGESLGIVPQRGGSSDGGDEAMSATEESQFSKATRIH